MNQDKGAFSRWTWLRRGTAVAFMGLLLLGASRGFPWFKGSTPAATLAGYIPLTDPLAALEVMLASRTVELTLVLGALILIGVALFMGPIFCGWVCPLGFLFDLNQGLRRRLRPSGLGSSGLAGPGRSLPREGRFAVLGLALGCSAAAGIPAFQTVSPINVVAWSLAFFPEGPADGTAALLSGIAALMGSVIRAGGPLLLVLALLLLLEYLFPRLWCRSLCPLGGLYSLPGRVGTFRVFSKGADACAPSCRRCTRHCPWGIAVWGDFVKAGKEAVDHPDCTRCGECVDRCPTGTLRMGFR